jgi:putative sugar O-methyltransferase
LSKSVGPIIKIGAQCKLLRALTPLEIGAGYGRIAYLAGSLFPVEQYVIVDIPPILAVSQNYLATVFRGSDIRVW